MSNPDRKPTGNSILRAVFVALSFLVQLGWLLLLILKLNQYSVWISLLSSVLTVLIVIRLYSKHTNSAMKMPWIMLIMALPVMGMSLYLLFELLSDPGVGKKLRSAQQQLRSKLPEDSKALETLSREDPSSAGQSKYLSRTAQWPVFENTAVRYFPEATDAFEAMKADLQKAGKFIFMEYFIIEDKSCFHEIEDILIQKVREGVDVRLMYDDIGSVGYVNTLFARRLNREGIQCYPVNPALPVLNLFMNHRDHRKITVIDGKIGYTGGYNLAEAYFDREKPFGKWKDTGLRLEGEAVQSLTAAFLEIWSNLRLKEPVDQSPFLDIHCSVPSQGYVQPYADNPLGDLRIAEDVYLNMISHADKTFWIMTPYLIITDELTRALGLAARRGVDVRIVTPGIPDKKTVYAVTRSYYAGLTRQGVRVFEYSPGFCHGKMCVSDGKIASIGTSNLDYRSLYHHFENNVLLMNCQAVTDMEEDFKAIFPQCREVTASYSTGRGAMLRTWQCILRLFAPLM